MAGKSTKIDSQTTTYSDDILNAYAHLAEKDYNQDKDWKQLTYQLKLSFYTRFPELVRKLKVSIQLSAISASLQDSTQTAIAFSFR